MNKLEDRRKISQIIFIIALIYGRISSSNLLNELNIRVRDSEFIQRARFRDKGKHKHNLYLLNESKGDVESLFVTMKRNFNGYYHLFDFNQSIDLIKKNLKQSFSLDVHKK